MLAKENPNNENDRKTAALWENHMDETAFKLHLKKGGSQFNKDQPYIRLDSTFNQKFKMDRLIKTIYYPNHQLKWDNLMDRSEFYSLNGCKSVGFTYLRNK